MDLRVGFGVDFHRLEKGLPLKLGGVELECSFGAVGHSDADVLLHAICDALLGALNLRDIGYHFSDQDSQYKNIASTKLLEAVFQMIKQRNYRVSNIDTTIVLETPKVNPHIPEMQAIIAEIIEVSPDRVSIKATTNEKLGDIGESKAIKAYATTLLISD